MTKTNWTKIADNYVTILLFNQVRYVRGER